MMWDQPSADSDGNARLPGVRFGRPYDPISGGESSIAFTLGIRLRQHRVKSNCQHPVAREKKGMDHGQENDSGR